VKWAAGCGAKFYGKYEITELKLAKFIIRLSRQFLAAGLGPPLSVTVTVGR
jgi:hypothetical protein